MSLRSIGPIAIDHRDPSLSWTSAPDANGARPAQIGGVALVASVQQLAELVANHDRRTSYGTYTGVLEFVDFDDEDLVGPSRGWYLLTSLSKNVEYRWSVTSYTAFSLGAVYLPDGVEMVVARSARKRANVHGVTPRAVVADPFRGSSATDPISGTDAIEPFIPPPAGATRFTREHDPAAPYSPSSLAVVTRPLVAYARPFSTDSDPLPGVVIPAPFHAESHATGQRGADVRVYDRGLGQEVNGPSHGFRRTSDILVTNGLLRFWIGPRGIRPFLNVEAVRSGEWRAVGVVALSDVSADVLRGARVVRATPEETTVVLTARNLGDISVTLRRDARGVDIHHGAERPPYFSATRSVSWRGMPPTYTQSALSSAAGKFGQGLTTTTGWAQWAWPWDVSSSSWAVADWWLPSAAVASQADSGLLGIVDIDGLVASVQFIAATDRLRFTLGAASIESDPITFAANAPIFWAASFDADEGMGFTVRVGSTTTHYSGPSTDPGADVYHSMALGDVRTPYGVDPYGDGPYGGSTLMPPLNGRTDNLMIFDGRLTEAERAALAVGTHRLDGIPSPEGRLVWHAPFDVVPSPPGSLLATGRRYQATAEDGATRAPDAWGLTKGLAALGSVTALTPFGLSAVGTGLDVFAFLATTDPEDDLADHHAQYSAASQQEVRPR